eukprot:1159143-Pelagomonas_calceolata.AAC.3
MRSSKRAICPAQPRLPLLQALSCMYLVDEQHAPVQHHQYPTCILSRLSKYLVDEQHAPAQRHQLLLGVQQLRCAQALGSRAQVLSPALPVLGLSRLKINMHACMQPHPHSCTE